MERLEPKPKNGKEGSSDDFVADYRNLTGLRRLK